jgi:hypothetical protein
MIRFRCQCGRQLQAPESSIGQPAKCPVCQEITTIPDRDDDPPPRSAPSRTVNEYGEITRPRDLERPAERPLRSPRRGDDDWDEDVPSEFRRRRPFANPPQTCADANTALWMGLVGLFCCTLMCPIALIYGIKALNQINKSDGQLTGTGQAVTGIVCGAIGLLLIVVQLLLVAFDN